MLPDTLGQRPLRWPDPLGLRLVTLTAGNSNFRLPARPPNSSVLGMPRGLPANWRPFFKQSIYELEAIVAQNQGDVAVLRAVLGELKWRDSSRARSLHSQLELQLSQEGSRGANLKLPDSHRRLPAESSCGDWSPQSRPGNAARERPVLPSGAPEVRLHESSREPLDSIQVTDSVRHGSASSSGFPEWVKVVVGVGVLLALYRVFFG
jgi:hypothetical protein